MSLVIRSDVLMLMEFGMFRPKVCDYWIVYGWIVRGIAAETSSYLQSRSLVSLLREHVLDPHV
jgi:hypothetical protein